MAGVNRAVSRARLHSVLAILALLLVNLALGPAAAQGAPPGACLSSADHYRTTDELFQDLDIIASANPDIAEVVDYGDSYLKTTTGGSAGYDLKALRLTNELLPGPKPVFFLAAGYHGNELPAPEIALRMIHWLVDGYGVEADTTWLLDWHEIWVVPTVNPDRRGSTRENANRIDLNRNHSFKWAPTQADHGSGPASEPEVAALEALIPTLIADQRGPDDLAPAPDDTTGIFITLHTPLAQVGYPWSHTTNPAPNQVQLDAIGRKLATFNGYEPGQTRLIHLQMLGSATDWVYGTFGVPAFLHELGPVHAPAYDLLDSEIWPLNKDALIYAAKVARAPYQIARGPDVINPVVTASGDGVTLDAVVKDNLNGGQSIIGAEVYLDTPPWEPGAAAMMLEAVDGSFDSVVESVTGFISTDGLSIEQHILFIRALDDANNWGPVTAAFLDLRPNQPPTIESATPDTPFAVQASGTETFSIVASDSDGDSLEYSWTLDGVSVSSCGEPFYTVAPTAADVGPRQLTVSVFDGRTTVSHTWLVVVAQSQISATVDNRDPNTTRAGTWAVSSAAGFWESDSEYSNADGTFTWSPELLAAGTYEVYGWWTFHPNRSTNVPYRITHDDGTATVIVDQRDQALGGQWNLLGTYAFAPGVNGQVTVSSENGQASADAVRLVGIDVTPPGNAAPVADLVATPTAGDAPLVVAFDASGSSDPDGDTLAYAWDFGDSVIGIGPALTHTFDSAGSYTVTLAVTDPQGGLASATATVTVTVPSPGTAIEVFVDNRDTNVTRLGAWNTSGAVGYWAVDSEFSDSGGEFSWNPALPVEGTYEVYAWWTFHANRSTNVPYRISHDDGIATLVVNQRDQALGGRWNLLGTYTFTPGVNGHVTVSSENGQANADAVRFVSTDGMPPSNSPPVASLVATPTSGDAPLTVGFDAAGSTDPDGDDLTFAWDFGDGSSDTGIAPEHTYTGAGSYDVTLTVTDTEQASDTATVTITASSPGDEVIVDNLDANTSRAGTWTTSTGPNPYNGNSVYSNAGGTFSWAPSLPSPGNYEVYAWWTFHPSRSTNVPYRISHDGGTATVTVNQHDQSQGGQWNLLGVYTLTAGVNGQVRVSSENGQASADAVRFVRTDTVPPPNSAPTASLVASPTGGDAPLVVAFNASGSSDPDGDTLTYNWDFGDGSNGSGVTPTHTYAESGSYTVTLVVVDPPGASDMATTLISVTSAPGQVIVDNLDVDTSQVGTWTTSSGVNPYEGNSVYSNSGGIFTWSPTLASPGEYDVYAWWTYHPNRSTNVPYRIIHNDGTTLVTVNQRVQALGGQWNLLGTFTLTPGLNGAVTVSSENGQASADAVRLVPR